METERISYQRNRQFLFLNPLPPLQDLNMWQGTHVCDLRYKLRHFMETLYILWKLCTYYGNCMETVYEFSCKLQAEKSIAILWYSVELCPSVIAKLNGLKGCFHLSA